MVITTIQFQLCDFVKSDNVFVEIRDEFKRRMYNNRDEYIFKIEIVDVHENSVFSEWTKFDVIEDILNYYIDYYYTKYKDTITCTVDRINFYQKKITALI